MHVHISWATVLIQLLSFIAVVGAVNLFARTHPSGKFAQAWSLLSSAN